MTNIVTPLGLSNKYHKRIRNTMFGFWVPGQLLGPKTSSSYLMAEPCFLIGRAFVLGAWGPDQLPSLTQSSPFPLVERLVCIS